MILLIKNLIEGLLHFKENPKLATQALLMILLLGVNWVLMQFTDFKITIDQITGIAWLYDAILSGLATLIAMAMAFFSRKIIKKVD